MVPAGGFRVPVAGCLMPSSGIPAKKTRNPREFLAGTKRSHGISPGARGIFSRFPRGVSPVFLRDTRGNPQEPAGLPEGKSRDLTVFLGFPCGGCRVPPGYIYIYIYTMEVRDTPAGNTREPEGICGSPRKSEGSRWSPRVPVGLPGETQGVSWYPPGFRWVSLAFFRDTRGTRGT